MEYRFLGTTGLEVSELCLGAMLLGPETEEKEAHRILDAFVEAGGNFVDTAGVYGRGVSEEVLGRWLAGRDRDDLVIATKIWDPHAAGNGRRSIVAGVDGSLRRLGVEYIDLFQMHVFDPFTPETEVLSTLTSLVEAGKIRYIGASNYPAWALQKAIDLARTHGWEQYVCLQPQYNLMIRHAEWELVPICQNEGLGLIPWGPLNAGWLSGRIRRGMSGPPNGTRVAEFTANDHELGWNRQATEDNWRLLDAVFTVAERLGRTPAQVALRWLSQQPAVTAPIIGPRTIDHLTDHLGSVGWTLDDELLRLLTDASDRPLPYPQRVLRDAMRQPRTP